MKGELVDMTWKDGIKKNFKSEGEEYIDKLLSRAKEMYKFLDYRAKRTKKTFERLDRGSERNLSPEEKDFKKKAKKENEEVTRLMFKFNRFIEDFNDVKRSIEETVNAENRVD